MRPGAVRDAFCNCFRQVCPGQLHLRRAGSVRHRWLTPPARLAVAYATGSPSLTMRTGKAACPTISVMTNLSFNEDQAIGRLMRFMAVEGITGQEEAIGQDVVKALIEAGVSKKHIHFDQANKQIPLPTQTGNLVVMLPGTTEGPLRLFMTHLDTVPLGGGAVPVRKGKRIVPAGKTALGGDNRTGV